MSPKQERKLFDLAATLTLTVAFVVPLLVFAWLVTR